VSHAVRSPSFFVAGPPTSSLFVRKGLHNITHPRTDAVVITAVLNETQDKILLGRNVGLEIVSYHAVSLIFWKSEKIPCEVLFHTVRFHRTWRIIRGCCQTRDLGRGWDSCAKREISLWTAMGSSLRSAQRRTGDSYRASRILPISWLGFMRSEIRWNLSGQISTMSWKVRMRGCRCLIRRSLI